MVLCTWLKYPEGGTHVELPVNKNNALRGRLRV